MNYYISDLHFGHARLNEKIDGRGFESTEQMDEYMIAQWNSRVKDGDHVFILGDLSVSSQGEEVNQIFHRLKGRKTLLIGNHDTYLQDPAFDKGLLEQAVPYLELQDGRYSLVLSHYPILFYNDSIFWIRKDGQRPICCTDMCITVRMNRRSANI